MAEKIKNEFSESIAYKTLIEPWITEEATRIAEFNKYVFKVGDNSRKEQIKRSIEDIYKVKVISVNIVKIPRKKRVRGRTKGWKAGFKKAIITVKDGQKIEIFEGK